MFAGFAAGRETRQALQAGPICIVPRQLEPWIAAALDALAVDDLPRFDGSGPLSRLRIAITAAFATCGDDAVFAWLRDDVLELLDFYATTTGPKIVRLRLQVVEDDMCRAFHVDAVTFRLVTTYRGPGTEWLAATPLAEVGLGQPVAPEAIRSLDRGVVAIMRGSKAATPERPGLLHRSPPIASTGAARLFLAINEVG